MFFRRLFNVVSIGVHMKCAQTQQEISISLTRLSSYLLSYLHGNVDVESGNPDSFASLGEWLSQMRPSAFEENMGKRNMLHLRPSQCHFVQIRLGNGAVTKRTDTVTLLNNQARQTTSCGSKTRRFMMQMCGHRIWKILAGK